MSRIRSAAILLVILMALLAAAGGAAAAGGLPALGPMLTPNPPVALPSAPPPPPAPPAPAAPHHPVRRAAVTSAPPAAAALPRTGLDAGFEALLGALLIATGAVLKARDPAARRLAGASYVELDPVPVAQRC